MEQKGVPLMNSVPGLASHSQSLEDQLLQKRVSELERILSAQLKDTAIVQKRQDDLERALEAGMKAQLFAADSLTSMEVQLRSVQMLVDEKSERTSKAMTDAIDIMEADMLDLRSELQCLPAMEAQLRSVQMLVDEKSERTSKALTDAIDIMEADMQDLRSELQGQAGFSFSDPDHQHRPIADLLDARLADTTSAIEKKFADMSSVQAELVQLSERCDNETTKLAKVVEHMGSKVAQVQTCLAQQLLRAKVDACDMLFQTLSTPSTPRDSANAYATKDHNACHPSVRSNLV